MRAEPRAPRFCQRGYGEQSGQLDRVGVNVTGSLESRIGFGRAVQLPQRVGTTQVGGDPLPVGFGNREQVIAIVEGLGRH